MVCTENKLDIKQGSLVIYQGKRCEVESITNTKVVLINLDKKNSMDWSKLQIELINLK